MTSAALASALAVPAAVSTVPAVADAADTEIMSVAIESNGEVTVVPYTDFVNALLDGEGDVWDMYQDGSIASVSVEEGQFVEYEALANAVLEAEEGTTTTEILAELNTQEDALVDEDTVADYKNLGETLTVDSVSAINNTTVEVKFEDAVSDVDSIDFEIEDLDIENAAVKQTDDHTVVLTTSAQEGGEKYTISGNGETLVSFTGVSAVVPEDISIQTNSVQGIVGKEVTVRADIDEEVAGVPVTFNINASGEFNKDQVVEVYTNENGVAEYSYTQYSGGEDKVVAYATGNPDVRATNGMVYWGVEDRLSLEEVDNDDTLSNGEKKVYKVTARDVDGDPQSGYVNIAYKENLDVAPEDAIRDVEVTDAYGDDYPYQLSTGGVRTVQVKLGSDGEATFTLEGENSTVTPIAFIDDNFMDEDDNDYEGNGKLDSTELQAEGPSVSYDLIHEAEIDVDSEGSKNAAYMSSRGDGGRDYTATVRDEDGDLVPEGTEVNVVVDFGVEESTDDVYFNGQKVSSSSEVFTLEADEDGEVSFTLTGDKDAYATPTVFVDNGDDNGDLDDADLQEDGEIVYFTEASVEDATLAVEDSDGDSVDTLAAGEKAYFKYQAVDQNGKDYDEDYEATFEVDAGANKVRVYNAGNGDFLGTVDAFDDKSFDVESDSDGLAQIYVESDAPTDVDVEVSASDSTLPNLDGSVEFAASEGLVSGETYEAEVVDFNEVSDAITLRINGENYDLDYSGDDLFIDNNPKSENEFENQLDKYDRVYYIKGDTESFDLDLASEDGPEGNTENDQYFEPEETPEPTEGDFESVTATDESGDGVADQLEIKFNGDIEDSSVSIADFEVENATVDSYTTGDSDDDTVTLSITPDEGYETAPLGTLTLADGETISFQEDEDTTQIDSSDSAEIIDQVGPMLTEATLGDQTYASASITKLGQTINVDVVDENLEGALGNETTINVVNDSDDDSNDLDVSYDAANQTINVTLAENGDGSLNNDQNTLVAIANEIDALNQFNATLDGSGSAFLSEEETYEFSGGSDDVILTFSEALDDATVGFDDFEITTVTNEDGTATVANDQVTLNVTTADSAVEGEDVSVTDGNVEDQSSNSNTDTTAYTIN